MFDSVKFDDLTDVIFYLVYVSPEGSPIYRNFVEKDGIKILQKNISDITRDYPNSHLFLGGDLNARTKDFLDYIPSDDLLFVYGDTDYIGDTFDLPRNNRDILKFNMFGKTLTDFCRTNDLHINNGRLFDDTDGNFTSSANNGVSVVDYNICNTALFDKCTYFRVENRTESDHFPINCQLTLKINQNQEVGDPV